MNNVEISIIVPVYNVGELLHECVRSLLNQTCREYEIILVDDGSTDYSSKICDEYSSQYDNIICIHQTNGGLSAARNTGIRAANGTYVLFVDSDDYIKEDTCKVFLEIAKSNECDMVAGDEIKLYGTQITTGYTRGIEINKVYNGERFLQESLKNGSVSMCAPYSMYKKQLIIDNNLYFKNGILHEDEWWTPQITLKAKRVIYSGYRFYYHRYREGSITHSKIKDKNSRDLILTCYDLYSIYLVLEAPLKDFLMDYLCMLFLSAVYIGMNYKADRKFALKTAYSRRNKVKALLFALSPRVYLYINKILKQIRNSKVGALTC